jgi:hypothetical protein
MRDSLPERLECWRDERFNPENLQATIEAMASAGDADESIEAKAEGARRKLADCDDRLAKYRSALESGADPVVVSGWMAEVQGERLRAEAELASCASRAPPTAQGRSVRCARALTTSLGPSQRQIQATKP